MVVLPILSHILLRCLQNTLIVSSTSRAQVGQGLVSCSKTYRHSVVSAAERSAGTHYHSGLRGKMLWVVCFSLNQSQLTWVALSPRYDRALAKQQQPSCTSCESDEARAEYDLVLTCLLCKAPVHVSDIMGLCFTQQSWHCKTVS